VQTARRGFGGDERDRATAGFLEAVRWATFAQEVAPELIHHRAVAKTDPDERLVTTGGPELTAFQANRAHSRVTVAEIEAALFPADEVSDGG
jgi:hypothetical protein